MVRLERSFDRLPHLVIHHAPAHETQAEERAIVDALRRNLWGAGSNHCGHLLATRASFASLGLGDAVLERGAAKKEAPALFFTHT